MDEELERLVSSIRQAGMPASDVDPDDDSIPTLTDVVLQLRNAPAAPQSRPSTASGSPRPFRVPGQRELEARIAEQILARLGRDPQRLENAVNEAVSAAADRFAVMIAIELGRDLEQTIRKALEPAIRHAVHEALAAGPEGPTEPTL